MDDTCVKPRLVQKLESRCVRKKIKVIKYRNNNAPPPKQNIVFNVHPPIPSRMIFGLEGRAEASGRAGTFSFFSSHLCPSHYSRPPSLPVYTVVTQIRGHIAGHSSPFPTTIRAFIVVAGRAQQFLPSSTRVEFHGLSARLLVHSTINGST